METHRNAHSANSTWLQRVAIGASPIVVLFAGLLLGYFGLQRYRFDPEKWKTATLESGERMLMEDAVLQLVDSTPGVNREWIEQNLGEPDSVEKDESTDTTRLYYETGLVPPNCKDKFDPYWVRAVAIEFDRSLKLTRWWTDRCHRSIYYPGRKQANH